MSERYTRKYTLPNMLYTEDAPIVITAGALLYDSKLERTVVQLKLKNISEKTITATQVAIIPLDGSGKRLGDSIIYNYVYRQAERGEYYGHQSAIEFPYDTAQSFAVKVLNITFDDNEIWEHNDKIWTPFHLNGSLATVLENNTDLIEQFKIDHGDDCTSVFGKADGLWQCLCGEYNRADENNCYKCNRKIDDMQTFDLEKLKEASALRLAEENRLREEEEKRKRKKKTKMIVIICLAVIVTAVAAILIVKNVNEAKNAAAYDEAFALLEEGDYDEAFDIFEELGDYKDSAKYVANEDKFTSYYYALHCLDYGNYGEAAVCFEELGDFEDSKEMLKKVQDEALEKCIEYAKDHYDFGSNISMRDIEQCREALPKLTGNEIKTKIVGKWTTYEDLNDKLNMTYKADGTAEFKRPEKDPWQNKWGVKGDIFDYTSDTGTLDYKYGYEVRFLDDNTLLLFDHDGITLQFVLYKQ